jgi:hypothetical protein
VDRTIRRRGWGQVPALALLLLALFMANAAGGEPGLPAASGSPNLKTDIALYHLDGGTLQYAFTFVNPTDSVVFLDCQVPPFARLSGNTLILSFDRTAFMAAADTSGKAPPASSSSSSSSTSAGGGQGVLAGGPLDGGAVNPDDFPPQRVGPHQAFQGQRKLDRVLGDPHARPAFAQVQLHMAWYPERPEGEGAPYLVERKSAVAAPAKAVARKGKAPPPPKIRKFRVPRETGE